MRRGLGYDRADVAVITNITSDHIGTDGIDTIDDLIGVKALVAEEIKEYGHLVLNADDRNSAGLARRPAVRDRQPVISYFSVTPGNPVIAEHLRDGGTAYLLDDEDLVEVTGSARATLASVHDLALSVDGQARFMIANVLAAIAAARALGVSVATIRTALESIEPGRDNPGRLDTYRVGAVPVVVDYAHNPAALEAVGEFMRERWDRDGVAVLTLPGDRTDAQVAESAQAVAQAFDRVVIYEDLDLRGREPGEMTSLIRAALTEARPGSYCESAASLEAGGHPRPGAGRAQRPGPGRLREAGAGPAAALPITARSAAPRGSSWCTGGADHEARQAPAGRAVHGRRAGGD